MRNLNAKGGAWLALQQRRNASTLVTYQRGATTLRVAAVAGNPDVSSDTTDVVTIEARSRDFIIEAASLVIGGTRITPAVGDIITDDTGTVFEVCDRGIGLWRFSDPQNLRLRIFTRHAPPVNDV